MNIVKHQLKNLLLLSTCLFSLLAAPAIHAEPPVHLSSGDVLRMLSGHSVSEPIKLQAKCSAEIEACWKAKGLNKDNIGQVFDACWQEAKVCPKVCKDEYFSRRKAGMNPMVSDPLFKGRRGEDTSCVPGVDELTHPSGKVRANDSTIKVTVTVGGQLAGADIDAIPVDAQGREAKRTTSSPNYSKRINNPAGPISLYLPAGRYRLRVRSPDRFYHPNQTFPDQEELVTVEAGKTLDKAYTFGMGRLVVKAQDKGGKPVAVMLRITRAGRPGYGQSIPIDARLLTGKYRLVVKETGTRREKVFDIDIKAGGMVTKTITFEPKSNP